MPNPPDTDPGSHPGHTLPRLPVDRSGAFGLESSDSTDALGRRLPTPPEVLPPRLPSAPVRRPSRRVEATNEVAVTTRLERLALEPDPAPLPPSPAAADASAWLERERPKFDAPPVEINDSSDATRPVAAPSPAAPRTGHSSMFTGLLAITMLVIGMILGALLAGR